MLTRTAVGIAVCITFLINACAGQQQLNGGPAQTDINVPSPPVMEQADGAPADLPAPADLLKEAAAFPASSTDTAYGRTRSGAGFDDGLPHHRVSADGSSVQFFPGDPDLPAGLSDVALCTYRFQIAPFLRMDAISFDWAVHPGPAGAYWVAVSDFPNDRWQWYPGPADGELLDAAPLDAMDDPQTGTLFVAVAVVSPQTPELAGLEITGPGWAHTWILDDIGRFGAMPAIGPAGDIYFAATYRNRLVAIRMTSQRELLWANALELVPGDSPNYTVDAAADNHGNLYVSSTISLPDSKNFQGQLVKLSPDGALLWCRQIDLNYAADSKGITYERVIPAGEFIFGLITGSALSSDPYMYNQHFAVACLTADGEPVWAKELLERGSDSVRVDDLAVSQNSLLAVGSAAEFTAGVGIGLDGVLLVSMDFDGAVLSQQRLISEDTTISGNCAIAGADGGYYVSGLYGPRLNSNRQLVLKLDDGLNAVKCLTWGGRIIEHRPTAIAFSSGKLIASATGLIDEYDEQGFATSKYSLLEFDAGLNLVQAASWNDGSRKWEHWQRALLDGKGDIFVGGAGWKFLEGWWHSYDDDSEEIALAAENFECDVADFEFVQVVLNPDYGPLVGLSADRQADEDAMILFQCNPADSEAILPTPWYN